MALGGSHPLARYSYMRIDLRAFTVKHGSSLRSSTLFTPVSSRAKKAVWLNEARTVINRYRGVLNGEVEDFVDLCAAVLEATGAVGEHASWFIDIMW
ncbi:hypothetical protein APHAL10511_002838 [Amanita phalloides]|nr:hypothetical protein APHAL10511_002838 [Amanita phalloides]